MYVKMAYLVIQVRAYKWGLFVFECRCFSEFSLTNIEMSRIEVLSEFVLC